MALRLDALAKAKVARHCGNDTIISKYYRNKEYLLCKSCGHNSVRILLENERRGVKLYFCSSKCISTHFDRLQESNPDYIASEIRSERGQLTVRYDEFEEIFQKTGNRQLGDPYHFQ
jgi:hypothetical protein